MDDITHTQTHDGMLKNAADISGVVRDSDKCFNSRTQETDFGGDGVVAERDDDAEAREVQPKRRKFGLGKKQQSYSHTHYKVYKRRWIGLAQLVLLNIVVSWDVSAPFPSRIHDRGNLHRENWLRVGYKMPRAIALIQNRANNVPVANIRPNLNLLSAVLPRLRVLYQLAQHCFPVLLRGWLSLYNLPFAPRP
jgi:hypothetical protein